MLAHHEALLVVQTVGPIGLTGWAALIGARWYSVTHRRSECADHAGGHAIDGPSSDGP
ncbi:hypothetical protein [Ilumatobacter sp.]|uniref:hypothetical protein n=1 Tax=Ilumatobacter sp. TaxID=1967498 RepID=UPI003C47A15B